MYLVIGRDNCSYCDAAKKLLDSLNKDYVYKNISTMDDIQYYEITRLVKEDLKLKTVPVVLKLIGGYAELAKEEKVGE